MYSKRDKLKDFILQGLVEVIAIIFIFYYLNRTVYEIPLMDYWIGLADYLDDIYINGFELESIITLPHALHWNPFFNFCQYFLVKIFKCRNEAYIYSGVVFMIFSITLVLKMYRTEYKCSGTLKNFIGATLFVMPIINLNQWEILTLFCNFAFMIRIFCFLLFFYRLDSFWHSEGNNVWKAFLLGLFSTLVMLFMGQAYLFGVYISTCCVAIFDWFTNRQSLKKYILILAWQTAGIVFYCLTLTQNSMQIGQLEGEMSFLAVLVQYMQGLLIMIAAVVLHTNVIHYSLVIYYIVGFCVLVAVIVALVMYVRNKLYKQSYFPILCLVYALANILIIIHGRASIYGIESVSASRYVVETTIGYLGLIQIYWMILCEKGTEAYKKILIILFFIGFICVFGINNYAEIKMGPYRKAYGDNMKYLALNIDEATDEQLGIFQAPADQVRTGIAALKKYNLCIWSNMHNEYTPGTEILFTKSDYNADKYITKGIYAPEGGYSWTSGDELKLECTMNNSTESMRGVIDLVSVYNSKQRAVIFVNGEQVYDSVLTNEQSIQFDFECKTSNFIMEIQLPDAISPFALGERDDRILALAISKIVFLEK